MRNFMFITLLIVVHSKVVYLSEIKKHKAPFTITHTTETGKVKYRPLLIKNIWYLPMKNIKSVYNTCYVKQLNYDIPSFSVHIFMCGYTDFIHTKNNRIKNTNGVHVVCPRKGVSHKATPIIYVIAEDLYDPLQPGTGWTRTDEKGLPVDNINAIKLKISCE